MNTIFDVAKYIINRCGAMSAMKLQRLCYYAQAWSLAWNDAPLFLENFEAWESGPVCPELFRATQGKYPVTADTIAGDGDNLSESEKDVINEILSHYAKYDAQWLSQLACMELPWKKVKNKIRENPDCDRNIPKECIRLYYRKLSNNLMVVV